MINGLIFYSDIKDNLGVLDSYSHSYVVCTTKNEYDTIASVKKATPLFNIDNDTAEFYGESVYISSIELNDTVIDASIDYILSNKVQVFISASRTLEQVGLFDAKYQKSPIMFIYSLGLLDNAHICGGVYLDKDDIDLMVQSNATLVLSPSYDANEGHGIPLLKLYASRGVKILLSTFSAEYNKKLSLEYERDLLISLVNGSLSEQVFRKEDLKNIIS